MSNIRIVCSKCRQRTIQADAYAVWDETAQAYVLQAVLDYTSCSNCGAENSALEEPLTKETG